MEKYVQQKTRTLAYLTQCDGRKTLLKEALPQVLSFQFCDICSTDFFKEDLFFAFGTYWKITWFGKSTSTEKYQNVIRESLCQKLKVDGKFRIQLI